jgi:hydroxypyruvate isomerase
MRRRDVLGGVAAAGLVAMLPAAGQQSGGARTGQAPPAGGQPSAPAKIPRKGRIKQGLWRINFGANTTLSFDDQCREAARVGAYGFDLIGPEDWPTLRKYGLEPLLAGAGPVTFPNGLIHPEVHKDLEASLRPYIDMLSKEKIRTFISIGGQKRGMPPEQAADNAVSFLNKIKSQLEDKNVTIAVENMNNKRLDPNYGREDQVFGHWEWGVNVCERVNSPHVKLVCDLYHLQIMDGDIAENIRKSIQWIAHFHTAGVPQRTEIDYTQEMNYRYIAQVIAELPFNGYVSHEWRVTPGRDPIRSIEEALAIMDV